MAFTSFVFLGFFLLVAAGYFLFPQRLRWIWLLIASLLFYTAAGLQFLGYLLLTALSVWGAALCVAREQARLTAQLTSAPRDKALRANLKRRSLRREKLWIAACIVLNLGVLAVLKYLDFGLRILETLSGGRVLLSVPALLLPLGISFYTFQSIGYLLDVHRGVAEAERNPLRVLLFLSFFPCVLQGPINRWNELSPQLRAGAPFDSARVARGAQRMLWGFFEKLVIADRLGLLVDGVFADLPAHGGWQAALAILLYAFQIYADFQGYMDIACGCGEIFGITIPENFRAPYLSASVPEFWRRWHITLGSWFRDYLYYPVMRSELFTRLRKKTRKTRMAKPMDRLLTVFALFVVWGCTGLWHGARTTYVAWGLYYGLLISLSTLLTPLWEKRIGNSPVLRVLRVGRTFFLVLLGYVLFRSDSLRQVGAFFAALTRPATGTPLALDSADLIVAGVSLLLLGFADVWRARERSLRDCIAAKPLPLRWLAWLTLLVVIVLFGVYGPGYDAASFLYFKY